MIIDCHTHWGLCFSERDGEDPSNWLELPNRHGIDRFFLFGHNNMVRSDLCRAENDSLVRVASRAPGRFIPIGTAWPQMGAAGVEEARRCIQDLGMPALKFHTWTQGFYPGDAVFDEICALAGELGVPLIFHDGTPCYSLPEQFAGLARRFPKTRLVLGHSGILWTWRSALEAARQSNIWLCLCGPHMRAIEEICRRVDTDRLLWGTDYGFGFADSVGYRLNVLLMADISDKLKEKILAENPQTLITAA